MLASCILLNEIIAFGALLELLHHEFHAGHVGVFIPQLCPFIHLITRGRRMRWLSAAETKLKPTAAGDVAVGPGVPGEVHKEKVVEG